LVIDGGFAEAYQEVTGIAGYTLIFNSYGLLLASHHPFESTQKTIETGADIFSKTEVLETERSRIRVRETDEGAHILEQIEDLKHLLAAYRNGSIKVT
jgi:fructose-1,6-bisphosphatase-3